MVEGSVDHGALLRREDSGSTIAESEDGLVTGEHLCLLENFLSHTRDAFKLQTHTNATLRLHLPSTAEWWIQHQDQVDRCGFGVGVAGTPTSSRHCYSLVIQPCMQL